MSSRIFISSVQKEFKAERTALARFIEDDPLLGKQFETFVFERDVPAKDRRPDAVYLEELAHCDLYLGLFGDEYGWEDSAGLSPTHLEFNKAAELRIPRLIYIKGSGDQNKHPKMRSLIQAAGNEIIRRRFESFDDLRANVYASLVSHLESTGILHQLPWDATPARGATLADVDAKAITQFVRGARKWRNFPLPEDASPSEVLDKLHLLDGDVPTQGAILLFGREPQRFLPASLVKCAHFHGTTVAKPIPAHLDVRGTAFDLVNGAVDFVLSKINVSVGTRKQSSQAPVEYEIPLEVIREAIVNAVAHRDYTSNASVQVSLFADRLEIWNPGNLPPALTLELLRHEHRSFPRNLLFAEALYLVRYIERYGTGTGDMIRLCREAGLPEPDFRLTDGFVTIIQRPARMKSVPVTGHDSGPVTPPVTAPVTPPVTPPVTAPGNDYVLKLLKFLGEAGAANNTEIRQAFGLKDRRRLRDTYLEPAIREKLIEYTIPEKPTSRLQKYRLTEKGRALLSRFKPL